MSLSDELRHALSADAASVRPTPDLVALGGALAAADARRRTRTVAGAAALAVALVAGAVAAAGALDGSRGSIATPPAGHRALPPIPTAPPGPAATSPPAPAPALEAAPPAAPGAVPPPAPNAAPTPAVAAPPPAPAPVPAPIDKPADPPPTTTKPAPSGVLTAAAAYGSCSESPPYDDYSGTAAPGAVVKITSAHSSPVTTTADASGHWSVRVYFPSAPVGTTFTVTVSSPGASSVVLGFTRTA